MKITDSIRMFATTIALLILASRIHAASIVTQAQRIEGTIAAEDDKSVTITDAAGKPKTIPREEILEIYDDGGALTWSARGPIKEPRKSYSEQKPGFASKSIILDFYVGSVFGGFYKEEQRFMDALGIYVKYSDGSIQSASNSYLTLGGGLSFQWYGSLRWSNLISYAFRSTSLKTSAGDGQKYESKTLGSEVTTALHALFLGKELHFYPSTGGSSLDIIGQVGYEFGNYKPLATYSALRTQLSPVPPQYIGTASVFLHGPTARFGLGGTLRFDNFQLRIHGYYQVAYVLASEQIWNAVEKNTLVHDLYAAISAGVGW